NYHPSFSDENTDVVLQSVEGTSYRVHSLILKTTSGFFRTMLSLPQPPGAKVPHDIPVGEKDSVMERVLRMMCGLVIPRWASLDEAEAAVELIDKWDAPGPLSLIRTTAPSSLFVSQPLRLYGLTSRFGWEEETTVALIFTLKFELLNGEHTDKLHRLSRAARFKEAMNGALFAQGNQEVQICLACQRRLDNNSLWRLLKEKLFMNMWGWPAATACFGAKCICGRSYYDQNGMVNNINEAIKLAIAPVATLS
ncbi:hypothetical protein C8F04DRAFT_1137436, partial [Mycena alexandri]